MFALIIFLTCALCALAMGVLAARSDWRGLLIPNIYPLWVAGLWLVAFGAVHLLGVKGVMPGLYSSLAGGLVFFGISAFLFAIGVMGAADSKLGTAFSLWIGIGGLPAYVFYMTVAGGILGLTALYIMKLKPVANPAAGSWIARLQGGESKVPYGVAIVIGAFIGFMYIGYFSPESLARFL